MFNEIKPAILITIFFTVVTGLLYPLSMTGVARVLFPRQADGSLVGNNGHVVGSELIGQNFMNPGYFHPRPSAAGMSGYDPMSSGGSNLGPTNPALEERLKKDSAQFRKDNPDYDGPIPSDAVTTSGSGLDPEISPANALAQVARVAKTRNIATSEVQALVMSQIRQRDFRILGEPRVNVLKLNLALDASHPMKL